MFTALLSPASYVTHSVPWALYLLVTALAIGYAAALLIIAGLDRYAERLGTPEATPRSEVITTILRDRWVWLTPMYAVALLIATWLVTRAQSAGASPFVYRSF